MGLGALDGVIIAEELAYGCTGNVTQERKRFQWGKGLANEKVTKLEGHLCAMGEQSL